MDVASLNNLTLFTNGTENKSFFDREEFIASKLGQYSLSMAVPISIIYSLLFISGIVGNVLTMQVIYRNAYMHTTTNFYLFSLAVSDLLMLLFGLPPELYSIWVPYPYEFPEFVCSGRALISEMTTNASILTITAFTFERYFAICHPMRMQRMSNFSRPRVMIGVIWLVSFIFAVPFGMYSGINYIFDPKNESVIIPESALCSVYTDKIPEVLPWFIFSTSFFFIIPVGVLAVLYTFIGLTLRNETPPRLNIVQMRMGSSSSETIRIQTQSRRSIVRMLGMVCLFFVVLWSPFHAQRILWATVKGDWDNHQVLNLLNIYLYSLGGCFYYASCVINTIIYNIMSRRYRDAFRETICSCSGARRNSNHSVASHSSTRRITVRRPSPSSVPPSRRTSHVDAILDRSDVVELCLVDPEGHQIMHENRLRQDSDDFMPVDPFFGSQYLMNCSTIN